MNNPEKSFGIWVSKEKIKKNIEDGGIDPLYYILQASDLQDSIIDALEEGSDSGNYDLVRVGDLFDRKKSKIDKNSNKTVYGIFAENVDRPLGEITGVQKKESGSYTKCEPGDILYYRMRPYLRKVVIIPDRIESKEGKINLNNVPLCCASDFVVLKPNRESLHQVVINRKYIWAVLRSDLTLFQVLPLIKGGTRPRVPFNSIMDLKVPLPDKKTQNEVVTKMEELQKIIKKYRKVKREAVRKFKLGTGEDLLASLSMKKMAEMDDDLITLLVEADILPKSYESEFY